MELESSAKAHLAVMRFPSYYAFAFTLLTVALVAAAVCCPPEFTKVRRWTSSGLLLLALLLTTVDYVWIYKPLEKMSATVEEARPAEFIDYHHASKWINSVQLGVSAVTAFAVCWPLPCNLSARSDNAVE